jgi:hypothetical protein
MIPSLALAFRLLSEREKDDRAGENAAHRNLVRKVLSIDPMDEWAKTALARVS